MKKHIVLLSVILSVVIFTCSCGNEATEKKSSKKDVKKNVSSMTENSDSTSEDEYPFDVSDFESEADYVIPGSDYGTDGGNGSGEKDDDLEADVYTSYYENYSDAQTPFKNISAAEKMKKYIEQGLKVNDISIDGLGLKSPVKLARISDAHLPLVNNGDGNILKQMASSRNTAFPNASSNLDRAVNYSNAADVSLLSFTGDIFDFLSVGNMQKFNILKKSVKDYMFSVGCNDITTNPGLLPIGGEYTANLKTFSNYVGYKNTEFDKREIGGVTIISMNNCQKTFTSAQVTALDAEIKKGKPIVLMLHTPLYAKTLYESEIQVNGNADNIIGKVATLSGETKEMVTLIESNKATIKAIFAGRVHSTQSSKTQGGIMQYTLSACYADKGSVEIITLN